MSLKTKIWIGVGVFVLLGMIGSTLPGHKDPELTPEQKLKIVEHCTKNPQSWQC